MSNLGEQLNGIQPVISVLVSGVFLLLLLMDKDELEEFAFNNALKNSIAITIISLLAYCFYMMTLGHIIVSIHVVYIGIEGVCILTLVLYYLNLKGISFEIKIKNRFYANILTFFSTIISVLATVSILFETKYFDNKIGYIRYDELILLINALMLTCLIRIFPKAKKVG